MRTVILLLALAAGSSTSANKLFVVMHTTDRVVVGHVCPQRLGSGAGSAVRRVVRQEGYVTWHATGGVPPYQVIFEERDLIGNICVTVMDAMGQIATGCGIVSMRN